MHYCAVRRQFGPDVHIFQVRCGTSGYTCTSKFSNVFPDYLFHLWASYYNYPKKKSEFTIFSLQPNINHYCQPSCAHQGSNSNQPRSARISGVRMLPWATSSYRPQAYKQVSCLGILKPLALERQTDSSHILCLEETAKEEELYLHITMLNTCTTWSIFAFSLPF